MALNLNKSQIGRKILLIAVACSVLGALGLFLPLSLALTALQSKVAVKPVSGDVVVVGIDSPSISEVGRWPWPRDKQAELIRKIDELEPEAIYLDIGYQGATTPAADRVLRTTLENLNAPIKVIASITRAENGSEITIFSHPSAVGSVESVTPNMHFLFGFVWEMPTSIESSRGRLPSIAASMAALKVKRPSTFPINFTYDPSTIPHIPSNNIINQTTNLDQIKGKTVILGVTDVAQNDVHAMPGWGRQPGVFFHVLAAETIKNGLPQNWGWIAFFGAALGLCAVQLSVRGIKYSVPISWAGAATILIVSTWLTTGHILNNPLPALALIISVGILIAQQKSALIRSQRNSETRYFNMTGY